MFPRFGIAAAAHKHLAIGAASVRVPLARNYPLRRVFAWQCRLGGAPGDDETPEQRRIGR